MTTVVAFALMFLFGVSYGHDFKGFDDTVLFKINWHGNKDFTLGMLGEVEPMVVSTNKNEKYQCVVPAQVAKEDDNDAPYNGPSPLELLMPLFAASSCSYRIESYWTYELCHGQYIKQFHEDREGKTIKMQEYFLGKWDKIKTGLLQQKIADAAANGEKEEKQRFKKIDGLGLPYFEIDMSDGTLCDLNQEPRTTKVIYVCYPHGKNEIYSLKETSTCNYEVIVLTPMLCLHPKYAPQETGENIINCVAFEGSPKHPRNLLAMEVESMKLEYQKLGDTQQYFQNTVAVFKVDQKDGTLKMELIHSNDETPSTPQVEGTGSYELKKLREENILKDNSPVKAFLEGKNCLTGGTGWWRYEFCYGRYVRQFHIDKWGEVSLMLGYFDESLHKEWLKENPHKKPKAKGARTQLSHFYQGGTFCEKTGKQRKTEVKLKCLETGSASTVSLYLLEPQTCQYILGVESPLICDILQNANEFGLVDSVNAAEENVADEVPKEVIVGEAVIEDLNVRFEND